MNEQLDLGFESISASEFASATRSTRATKTKTPTERTRAVWFSLPTALGECTVPSHLEVMKSLGKEQQEYRKRYPVRMVYEITPGVHCCRDCFLIEADVEVAS